MSLVVWILWACGTAPAPTEAPAPEPPPVASASNVLLVILDDVGIERVAAYGVTDRPATPTLSRLADEGILFRNAYANPSCSPTRAGMFTGRHGMHIGIGNPLAPGERGLRPLVWSLPEALDELTGGAYAHAAVGKWHITTSEIGPSGPIDHGFQHYAGNLDNLVGGTSRNYHTWTKVQGGKTRRASGYITTDEVDTAIRFTERMSEPWFLWLAFNACHAPWGVAPPELIGREVPGDAPVPVRFDACLEAADKELGRLLDHVPEDTHVIVIGDNGTPPPATRPPYRGDHAKFTIYEGGVRVPLVISGPTVAEPGREVTDLVSHVDVFPTVLELAGVQVPDEREIDGVSLVPYLRSAEAPRLRRHVYAEAFKPNSRSQDNRYRWDRMVRAGPWKLVSKLDQPPELYRPTRTGLDGPNLLVRQGEDLEVQEALARLQRILEREYVPPQ